MNFLGVPAFAPVPDAPVNFLGVPAFAPVPDAPVSFPDVSGFEFLFQAGFASRSVFPADGSIQSASFAALSGYHAAPAVLSLTESPSDSPALFFPGGSSPAGSFPNEPSPAGSPSCSDAPLSLPAFRSLPYAPNCSDPAFFPKVTLLPHSFLFPYLDAGACGDFESVLPPYFALLPYFESVQIPSPCFGFRHPLCFECWQSPCFESARAPVSGSASLRAAPHTPVFSCARLFLPRNSLPASDGIQDFSASVFPSFLFLPAAPLLS